MNKKDHTEPDIRNKYIAPSLKIAGWDPVAQFLEKFPLTNCRVFVRGQLYTVEHGELDKNMQKYEANCIQLIATREMFKKKLMQALGGRV